MTQKRKHKGYQAIGIRHQMWQEIDGNCPYCGQKMWVRGIHQRGKAKREATIEHIIPKSEGGSNEISNLTVSCNQCNRARGRIPHEQFIRIRKMKMWNRLARKVKKGGRNYMTPGILIEHWWFLAKSVARKKWNNLTEQIFNQST